MLRLLSFKAQGCKDLWKPSKSCHVGIHWIALAENSQMSTHMPGFQSFSDFFHHFVLAKLATSRVSLNWPILYMHITSFIFSFVNKQARWLEHFVSTAHYLTISMVQGMWENYQWIGITAHQKRFEISFEVHFLLFSGYLIELKKNKGFQKISFICVKLAFWFLRYSLPGVAVWNCPYW